MSKTLCKDAVMIPITVIERYVVIMTPNIEQKHDISFEMAQNVIFLHLYNMWNINTSFFLKNLTMRLMQCDATEFLHYGPTISSHKDPLFARGLELAALHV